MMFRISLPQEFIPLQGLISIAESINPRDSPDFTTPHAYPVPPDHHVTCFLAVVVIQHGNDSGTILMKSRCQQRCQFCLHFHRAPGDANPPNRTHPTFNSIHGHGKDQCSYYSGSEVIFIYKSACNETIGHTIPGSKMQHHRSYIQHRTFMPLA